MKYYQSKAISLRYDAEQDRLQWIALCGDDAQVITWLTRNLLVRILPQFSQWLNDRGEKKMHKKQPKMQSQSEMQFLQNFEHEAAQHQVAAVKEKQSVKKKVLNNFLLYGVNLTLEKNGMIKLILSDKTKKWAVVYVLSLAEMHKLLREMINLSDTAGWKIIDPWRGSAAFYEKKKSLIH